MLFEDIIPTLSFSYYDVSEDDSLRHVYCNILITFEQSCIFELGNMAIYSTN